MSADETFLLASELATMRAEVERAGFAQDPLVGEHADRAHYGLNIAVAWPFPAPLDAAYRKLAERLATLDPGVYAYPQATTHVTVMTAVNFKRQSEPSAATIRAVDAAATSLGDFLASDAGNVGPIRLEVGPPVLARAAAFLPMRDPSGHIARVRERALAFCRTKRGVLADASAPRAVHSTVLRFREVPRDAAEFIRGFDEIARTMRFDPLTIDDLLVTLETKPYMREGRIARAVPLR